MKSQQELLGDFGHDPERLAQYAWELQEQLSEKERLLAEQQQLLAEARAQIAELKQQLFGPKADKLTPEQEAQLKQLVGDMEDQARRPPPSSQGVLEEEPTGKKKRSRPAHRRRRPIPVHLETQRTVLEPEDKQCEGCGQEKKPMGEEITTEYDFIPAKLICREIVRPKYGCHCGGGGVSIAPLPPRLVPQSKLGLGLAVYILLSRFDDHLSYYTLERIFRERHGVLIPRQQMVQWVEKIAFLLLLLYRLIWEEMQVGDYLQIDETPVKVLDPEVKGKAGQGYLWFYAVPGGDVFLEFCDSRGRDSPRQRLENFQGTIQTDAYEVYDSLRRERPTSLKRLGCLSHVRRRFLKALQESSSEAVWFIAQIRQLYRIEEELREASPQQRRLVRRQKAPRIWLAMKRHAEGLQREGRFLPKSTMGKALNYFLNEYPPLVGYLREGRFEIDNNLIENEVRPSAVGRRRWLFIGHPEAGWRSAVIYTLIQSCRRRGINPQEYLTDVLQRLPSMKNTEVKQLLPSRWKPKTASVSE